MEGLTSLQECTLLNEVHKKVRGTRFPHTCDSLSNLDALLVLFNVALSNLVSSTCQNQIAESLLIFDRSFSGTILLLGVSYYGHVSSSCI